jgi:hypothetical protein
MPLSQHPTDHAQKRARSTNGLCGLGVRKLSARSSLHQLALSFFHAVSRVPPRNLLKKVKIEIRRENWAAIRCRRRLAALQHEHFVGHAKACGFCVQRRVQVTPDDREDS